VALSDYQTALVTGASSGIGAAVVRALTRHDIEVHAVARRTERLQQLAQETGCIVHTLDLRDRDGIYELCERQDWDILVNNAGVLLGFEEVYTVDPQAIDASIDTNVRAVYHLLRAVLPGMVARRRGHVVNLGSMAGLYALRSSVYGGTKGAVHMISRNLRLELHGSGVRVTEICPGRVATEIYDQAIAEPELLKKLKDTRIRELDPEDIAAAVMYAVDSPWHVNVNLIELQPTEQTYGGSQFVPGRPADKD
jgi:NADP-dependent 3-hydroxy acid dehydrogenase YdfG